MCGCESCEIVFASRSNRWRTSGEDAMCVGRTFTATVRSSRVSRARYTSPIPPAPRGPRTSYGPNLVPEARLMSYSRRQIVIEASRREQIESYLNGVLDAGQFLFGQASDPRTEARLVYRSNLIAEDSGGGAADFDPRFAGIERLDVARDREDDDAGSVPVAGVVRDDDRRSRLPDLRPECRVEGDPIDVAAARRTFHAGQSSTSVLDHSDASPRRHGSCAAAL